MSSYFNFFCDCFCHYDLCDTADYKKKNRSSGANSMLVEESETAGSNVTVMVDLQEEACAHYGTPPLIPTALEVERDASDDTVVMAGVSRKSKSCCILLLHKCKY